MNKFKKGNVQIVVVAMIIPFLVVGGFFFWQLQSAGKEAMTKRENIESAETEAMEKKEVMAVSDNETVQKDGVMMAKILAKKNSTFSEFNLKDYEKALSEGKIVYLEFYANWCPICRAQETELIEGFNKLKRDDVAGFRVNFKDDQTDEDEKSLAEKFKIPYQHHKIVLKGGQVVINSADTWDVQTLVSELSNL